MKTLIGSVIVLGLVACGGVSQKLPPAAAALDRPLISHYVEPTPTPESVQQLLPAAPAPAAEPIPAEKANPAAAAPAPPPAYRWRVIGPGINVAIVGVVGAPCQGVRPPVPFGGAYWDGCHGAWLMAHPVFFGAMNGWGIGTAVSYWDGDGIEHVYHITSNQVFPAGSGVAGSYGAMTFQVCTDNIANGSPVRVLGAS